MFFGGGLVPFYILIKDLKLIDTLAVMIIPFFCSSFNLLVLKTFFSNLPSELEDAARVDGMGYFGIFFKIVLPLSKPVIACIALFVAVAQWNNWFTAMMFIRDADKWPVAYLLQQVLIQGNTREASGSGYVNELLLMGNTVKSAITIVSIVPIIIVYPWLQKYFVSGLTIGSVKG
jgi:putative aldouronate transport system permease protein